MAKHTALINRLWSDATDRKMAEAFAARFADVPGMEDRIPALLHEAAKPVPPDTPGEKSMEYLMDFARAIGTPPHAMAEFDGWANSAEVAAIVAPEAPPAPVPPVPLAPTQQPPAQPVVAAPPQQDPRAAALGEIARFERMMREAPREYWQPQNQRLYREALATAHGLSLEEPGALPPDTGPAPTPADDEQAA
jgi:hypothetical protein